MLFDFAGSVARATEQFTLHQLGETQTLSSTLTGTLASHGIDRSCTFFVHDTEPDDREAHPDTDNVDHIPKDCK